MFVVLTVVSTFAFNYNVSLPKLADVRFGDEKWFGWLLSVTSIGSLAGSLLTASRSVVTMRWFLGSTLLLGVSGIALSWSPHVAFAFVARDPARHRRCRVHHRRRTRSRSSTARRTCAAGSSRSTAVAFLGSTPIGGPITGLVADSLGAEWGLAYGSLITLAVVAVAVVSLRRAPLSSARPADVPTGEEEPVAATR